MLRSLNSIFKIPELRKKIIFTALMLIVYRLGSHLPSPGVSAKALTLFFQQQANSLFQIYNLFSGGNLRRMTVFALGIMPYISASIILQLLMAVFPFFERLKKEGEAGRKKITQYTRYGTVLLSIIQGYGLSIFMESIKVNGPNGEIIHAVSSPGLGFRLLTIITLTAGTIFIMWLGEQITEHGIGNGISLIIFAGIIARAPAGLFNLIKQIQIGEINVVAVLFLAAFMVLITAAVIMLTQSQRKVPVQYPRRIVGRKVMGGQNTFLPLKVNAAGVIPIIFAQSIMMVPSTLATFARNSEWLQRVVGWFAPGAILHTILYSLIIIFFTYFYTAITMNPVELAENMQKYGGFIPGIKPGKNTADYIDRIISRITLPGAIFLAFIAVLPYFLMKKANIPFYFGGTALLIVVGVGLDTLQQIESHLLMRHYDGFMKRGRLRGRR